MAARGFGATWSLSVGINRMEGIHGCLSIRVARKAPLPAIQRPGSDFGGARTIFHARRSADPCAMGQQFRDADEARFFR
jgi:hypothetical protein